MRRQAVQFSSGRIVRHPLILVFSLKAADAVSTASRYTNRTFVDGER